MNDTEAVDILIDMFNKYKGIELDYLPTYEVRSVEDIVYSINEFILMSKKLQALENAGVDNWSGYDYAMEELNE